MGMVSPGSIYTPPTVDFFKDNSNRWRTTSLFYELNETDKFPAIFTLAEEDKEVDGVKYISVKRKYLEYGDPTEYIFASKIFGDYSCWEAVCRSPAIKPYIDQWRKELQLKLKGEGIQALRLKMSEGDVTAGKWFAEEKWKEPTRRGRPSKLEKERRMREEMNVKEYVKEAAGRLGVS